MGDLRIEVRFPDGTLRQQALSGDVSKIGRLASAAVQIEHASVSRMHALIERGSGGWTIIDLGSAQGTKLDGKSVNQARLYNGASVTLGEVEVRVLSGGEPTLRDFQAPAMGGGAQGFAQTGSGYFDERGGQHSPRLFLALGAAVAVMLAGVTALFVLQDMPMPADVDRAPVELPIRSSGLVAGTVSLPTHPDAVDVEGWSCSSGFLSSFRGVDVGPPGAGGLLRLFEDPMYGERVRMSLEEGAVILDPDSCEALSVVLEDAPSPSRTGALMFKGHAKFTCATAAGQAHGELSFSECDVP